jgi:hypothetical protein
MATSTDAAGADVPSQENRITLRDPIRESEGLFVLILLKLYFNTKNI